MTGKRSGACGWMVVIKGVLCLLVLISPLLVGCLYKNCSVPLTYLAGQLTLWAVFQVIAVAAVNLRTSFTLLFWGFSGAALLLTGLGLKSCLKIRFKKPQWSVFLIPALLVIAFQAGKYIFQMHLDEDDARWLAEANDALVKNKMLLHNPATGEYIGHFMGEMVKDVFSPWAFYVAWLSRVTQFGVAGMAHTIFPPVLLVLSYCAYYEIGRRLFRGKTEQGIFLLMAAVINLFMAGNVYTQSVFSLTRIWQGKAVVAAVLVPSVLLCALIIQQEDVIRSWLLLAVTSCAGCLFSGMGIAVGLLMIAVYGGYTVICRRWKRIPLLLLAMVPSLLFGGAYFLIK